MSRMSQSQPQSLLRAILRGSLPSSKDAPAFLVHLIVLVALLVLGALQHAVLSPAAVQRRRRKQARATGGDEDDVAIVDSLWVYPIKSCAGSRLHHVDLFKSGLELDRNWAVVRTDTHAVLSLRQEPRLTLIEPTIDDEHGVLTIALSAYALASIGDSLQAELKPFSIPLRPTQDQLRQWDLIPELPMWGDAADGRVVQPVHTDQGGHLTPAEWLTKFLGYPATLVQFDTTPSSATRTSYPIYRPPRPSSPGSPTGEERGMQGPRGLHFADEYPLLVATVESLAALEDKIAHELAREHPQGAREAPGQGQGRGRPSIIRGLRSEWWIDRRGDEGAPDLTHHPTKPTPNPKTDLSRTKKVRVDMRRFRPNVVLRAAPSLHEHGMAYEPFAEDEWETLWFEPSSPSPPPSTSTSTSASSQGTSRASEQGQRPPQAQAQAQDSLQAQTKANAKLHLIARCSRCTLTAVDPTTATRDAAVPLRLLSHGGWRMRVKVTSAEGLGGGGEKGVGRREPCFGMYACPVRVGGGARGGADEDKGEGQDKDVDEDGDEDGPERVYGRVSVGDRVRVRWRPRGRGRRRQDGGADDGEEDDDTSPPS